VRCDELEPLIEAIADGTFEPAPEDRAHLSSCAACAARLAHAQSIEQWLTSREIPRPPASFTASVMARIGHEKWKTERVFDIGFNLAIAAGVLVILAGGAGLAWSLGFFTIDVDVIALVNAATSQVEGRVINQLQTVAIAAVVLTMALVLWWWAETATD
jgi:anti-sigma factor RsiW